MRRGNDEGFGSCQAAKTDAQRQLGDALHVDSKR